MIVFAITPFDEIRIVKADDIDTGLDRMGLSKESNCCLQWGTIDEAMYKNVIEIDYVICVSITKRKSE